MLENKADFHCDLGKSVLYRIDRTLGPFFNETNKDMHPPLDLALENEIATSQIDYLPVLETETEL